MAGDAKVNPAGGKDYYPGKTTLFGSFDRVVGGLIVACDMGFSGGVTSFDPFLMKIFPAVYEKKHMAHAVDQLSMYNQLLQAFTAQLYLAAFAGLMHFRTTSTRVFGRKWSMFSGGLTFLIGVALNSAAENDTMLIVGRILLAMGVVLAFESIAIGILAAELINYGTTKIGASYGWHVSLVLAAVPAGIITLGFLFLPDTHIADEEANRAKMAAHNNKGAAKAKSYIVLFLFLFTFALRLISIFYI